MFRRTWWLAVMTPRAALKLLDLSPNTDLNQKSIKKAYLKRVLECHPDLNPNDTNANANFRDLSEALNIALHALDASQSPGRPSSAAGEGSYDPQASINALRKAIVAYHSYRDQQDTTRTGGEETQTDAFFTPSLEYISSVCRQENLARSRVHTFCESLPAVISGGSSGSLIEAVAFFHTRYVESMSVCVMRFSQNLPTIVRRVVKNRRRHISYRKTRLTSGIGTGTRPQEQRIEDMTMKPLVLMGALLFDLPEDDALLRGASGSTCGVSSPKEIKVADELKCTIYPSDSIGIIVDKLSRWEADSFERLKIELAIVDSTTLLTNLLGFDNDSQGVPKRAINMAPHIQSGKAQVKTVLLTLQSLSANMCYYFEECDAVDVEPDLFFENLAAADDKESSADTDASVKLSVPKLIRHCRKFFRLASPSIKGDINLHWSEESHLIHSEEEMTEVGESQESSDRCTALNIAKKFLVSRHPTCCMAEEIYYSVSIEVDKDIRVFLLALRTALKTVAQQVFRCQAALSQLIDLREKLTKEEFILIEGQEEVEEENRRYRYRGPIQCIPRLYNISTTDELHFWKEIYMNREYLAKHAPAMNSLSVFYDCAPYKDGPSPAEKLKQDKSELLAGWVGDGDDECDNVILTREVLHDGQLFLSWLEEVVEQSSLNREAEETLFHAGVGYVERHPELPLTNYLSFVKIFVGASAVRSVIEKDAASGGTKRVLDGADIGLRIIVGTKCDVSEGGRLFIPWYMDPNTLIVLLGEKEGPEELEI